VKKIAKLMCICAIFAGSVVLGDAAAQEDKTGDFFGPSFGWSDVPFLLELAESEKVIKTFPSNPLSSYAAMECVEGMVALWIVEGLRRGQCRLTERMQTGEGPAADPGNPFLRPLNPICSKEGMSLKDCEASAEIHRQALEAYRRWWKMAGSLPSREAAIFDPLDLTDIQWYGGSREGELEICEKVRPDGVAAQRVAKNREGRALRTVYYALKRQASTNETSGEPYSKGPYTKDMLALQRVVLHFYDDKGSEVFAEDHFPGVKTPETPAGKRETRDEVRKKFDKLVD
jgi:hypothetical protein